MQSVQKFADRLVSITQWLRTREDRGASLVEYALLIGLIAVVCVGAVRMFGEENGGLLEGSATSIVDATGP